MKRTIAMVGLCAAMMGMLGCPMLTGETFPDDDMMGGDTTVSVTAMGTWTLGDGDLDAIRGDLVYFNLHTADNPAGEIRGQITAGDDANSFVATLSGDQEVPAVETGAGGTGTLTLNEDGTEATFDLTATGLSGSLTGAHFHTAAAGENGEVIFAITDTIIEQ